MTHLNANIQIAQTLPPPMSVLVCLFAPSQQRCGEVGGPVPAAAASGCHAAAVRQVRALRRLRAVAALLSKKPDNKNNVCIWSAPKQQTNQIHLKLNI